MWPAGDVLSNVLILAAMGCGAILMAALGYVLGRTARGRRLLKASPVVLAVLLAAYVATTLALRAPPPAADACIYAPAHPSDCVHGR